MMKVLVVSSKYPPEYSGSGLRAHNTYRRLSRKYGIQFDVITSSITSNRIKQYEVDGVSVRVVANKLNGIIGSKNSMYFIHKAFARAADVVKSRINYSLEAIPILSYLTKKSREYDAIHVFGNVNITSAAISYAKLTGKDIVIELVNLVDNPHQYEPLPATIMLGRGFPKHAILVCISEYLKRVCQRYGYGEEQIWCRPNPVDERKFFYESDRRAKYRKVWPGCDESDVLLVHLAKFMPRKQQLFMVEVMTYLPQKYKLILAGPLISSGPLLQRDHEYYQRILNTVSAKGLEQRVRVLPRFIENPDYYIKAADIFVLPATLEGLGTPVLEALACGVPAVTNDIPGVFDQWVDNGVNGYVCNLDQKEWAKKIMMANEISENNMKRASSIILELASTEVIDRQYYEKLTSLAKKNNAMHDGVYQ